MGKSPLAVGQNNLQQAWWKKGQGRPRGVRSINRGCGNTGVIRGPVDGLANNFNWVRKKSRRGGEEVDCVFQIEKNKNERKAGPCPLARENTWEGKKPSRGPSEW